MRRTLFISCLWIFGLHSSSFAQLIQGTIKTGPTADQFEIWLKPNFSNSTQYLFQIGLPIAFPAAASPQPTGLNYVLDAGFTSAFGSNYSVTVNPVATATGGAEKYLNIVLVRGGAGASNPQTWTSGTEFKVLTGTFTYSSGSTGFLAKLADYQDGGGDGQGNFYTLDGNANYYVTSNSVGNFYASAGISQTGGTASAGYAQLLSTSLPVNLVGFSGYRSGLKNILQWTTQTEVGSRGFDIQRSADGTHFQPIGFVQSQAGSGSSALPLHYRFEDNTPSGAKQFYRLQQQNLDGHGTISSMVIIQDGLPTRLRIDGLFPNPVLGETNLLLSAPGRNNITLLITDGYGRQVWSKQIGIEGGTNSVPLNLSALATGNYWLQVLGANGEKLIKKLVKQ